jgi:CcmD family protein
MSVFFLLLGITAAVLLAPLALALNSASAQDLTPSDAAPAPVDDCKNLSYLVAAYLIIFLALFSYLTHLFLRMRELQREITDLKAGHS